MCCAMNSYINCYDFGKSKKHIYCYDFGLASLNEAKNTLFK